MNNHECLTKTSLNDKNISLSVTTSNDIVLCCVTKMHLVVRHCDQLDIKIFQGYWQIHNNKYETAKPPVQISTISDSSNVWRSVFGIQFHKVTSDNNKMSIWRKIHNFITTETNDFLVYKPWFSTSQVSQTTSKQRSPRPSRRSSVWSRLWTRQVSWMATWSTPLMSISPYYG